MGVKSTVYLTRDEAEARYVDLRLDDYRGTIKAIAATMSDGALVELLATLNDRKHGGEGFENYRIESGRDEHGSEFYSYANPHEQDGSFNRQEAGE